MCERTCDPLNTWGSRAWAGGADAESRPPVWASPSVCVSAGDAVQVGVVRCAAAPGGQTVEGSVPCGLWVLLGLPLPSLVTPSFREHTQGTSVPQPVTGRPGASLCPALGADVRSGWLGGGRLKAWESERSGPAARVGIRSGESPAACPPNGGKEVLKPPPAHAQIWGRRVLEALASSTPRHTKNAHRSCTLLGVGGALEREQKVAPTWHPLAPCWGTCALWHPPVAGRGPGVLVLRMQRLRAESPGSTWSPGAGSGQPWPSVPGGAAPLSAFPRQPCGSCALRLPEPFGALPSV